MAALYLKLVCPFHRYAIARTIASAGTTHCQANIIAYLIATSYFVAMSMVQKPKLGFFQDLQDRGIVKQSTEANIAQILDQEVITVYIGFDPTSDCLHIGNLFPLLLLKRFQEAGHRVIAVIGGATGMIGDPSGKTTERSLLGDDLLQANIAGITAVIGRFIDCGGQNPALIVNNADWFRGISYLDFLRDIGKHFTVNHMIAKESVRARLEDREHGISYTEFSYMLLQAYDFYILNQKHNCRLEVGGSDQWGNITAGVELIRRLRALPGYNGPAQPVFAFTHPLILKSDGTKFGKSEQGSVWLDAAKTSAYRFYQFLVQLEDSLIGQFLRYFSFMQLAEIIKLEQETKEHPEQRLAQKALARELTLLVHGQSALDRVLKASEALFGQSIAELDGETLLDVLAGAPSTKKALSEISGVAEVSGIPLIDLVAESDLCQSKGAARKEIQAGGIYVNNVRTQDINRLINKSDLIAGHYLVLRRGKRTYHLLVFEPA